MMVFIVFSIQMSRMRTNQRSLMLASKLAETDAANKAKSEFLSLDEPRVAHAFERDHRVFRID